LYHGQEKSPAKLTDGNVLLQDVAYRHVAKRVRDQLDAMRQDVLA
jgi:hypothetical protein